MVYINIFMQTFVDFLPRKYDIISQLCHGYAKDHFWAKWLICQIFEFDLLVQKYLSISEYSEALSEKANLG